MQPEQHSAFEVLDIAPNATLDEILFAYRTLAKQYHPDRVAHLGPEFRDLADRRMKAINHAYDELRQAHKAGAESALRPYSHARPDTPTISVDSDSRGVHPNLEEAVRYAPAGAILVLSEGVHHLRAPLVVSRPITLLGAGTSLTCIMCAGQDYVVRFDGQGTNCARDLSFEHSGDSVADTVVVMSGSVVFERCRFAGAVARALDDYSEGGSGLCLYGITSGIVRDCDALNNGRYGIRVSDQATPMLETSTCRMNGLRGIAYFGCSAGTARGNVCTRNPDSGIFVGDQARPTLEANTCKEGTRGIVFSGRATGVARHNICNAGWLGIHVTGEAEPTLEANTCGQQMAGIQYSDGASGSARENECYSNHFGILVAGHARPVLEANTCRLNSDGIAYVDSAAGVARQNTCEKSIAHGISAYGQARPVLEGNACRHNNMSGIGYGDSAAGIARGNVCANNAEHGIHVLQSATPYLHANICRANGHFGILMADHACPYLAENVYGENGAGDSVVEGYAEDDPF